jgi:serine/threonine-protein kinase
VKPDNVMIVSGPLVGRSLNRRSWVKLIDLGAARKIERVLDPRRKPEPTMGTSWYMSPEAVLGMDLDERADIYSLGVLLYEAIVGRVPFVASQDEEIFRMHLWTPAPQLSSVTAAVSTGSPLEQLVARCLEKAPGARPSSMYEFLDLLDAADLAWRAEHPPRPESEDPTQHIPPLRPGRPDEKETRDA